LSKQSKNNDKEKQMSFWDHLEELRWHLMRSFGAVVAMAIVAFLNRRIIFDEVILSPSTSEFITNRMMCRIGEFLSLNALCMDSMKLQIININMPGQFLTHMYISFVAGTIVAFPYILYQFWSFVRPGLREKEAKYSGRIVTISSLLFYTGILFSFFIIVPLTVNFLGTYQVSESVLNQIALNSYVSTVVSVTFAVGIVFELPILIFFLTKAGLVTPAYLKRNRKYTIVILLSVAAIITPPDMFSQILVVIPLMGLYEVSILIAQRIERKKEKEAAE
jgi:sec-independent protein translocase protein TatC